MRAGNLYLTAPDVVALAIENNLDVEVQRYGPLLAKEVLLRAQSGGVLRSVGLGVAAGPQSVSLQGVSVNTGRRGGEHGRKRRQLRRRHRDAVGAVDSVARSDGLCAFTNFAHTTTPQSNTFLTGTTALVQGTRRTRRSMRRIGSSA